MFWKTKIQAFDYFDYVTQISGHNVCLQSKSISERGGTQLRGSAVQIAENKVATRNTLSRKWLLPVSKSTSSLPQ